MKNNGYISLYRSIQSNFIWNDKPFARGQAWIDLLLRASYEERSFIYNNQIINLDVGELITSIKKLSDDWGWSRDKVTRFLKCLADASMISYQTDTHKTVIKVLNFNDFQDCKKSKQVNQSTANRQPKSSKSTANRQQTDTYNKGNKYNKSLDTHKRVSKDGGEVSQYRELGEEVWD